MTRAARSLVLAAALVTLAVVAAYMKRSDVYLLSLCCVYLMATFGLNLTVGYAGQMSLGQAAFFGIGAYHAAILLKLGWPFFAVLPIAALACFVIGLALGFPALRVQHHYLAFATLGFNVLVYLVMRNEEKITGGTYGISGIPRPTILGVSMEGHYAFFLFTLASLVVLAGLLWWLLRSPWGRAFAALRDNPIRAESLGVNITAYTLLAFATCCSRKSSIMRSACSDRPASGGAKRREPNVPLNSCAAAIRLSRTGSLTNTCNDWNVRPTPRRDSASGDMPVMSSPQNSTRPDVGLIWPRMLLKSVVLPEPLGPITPTISPGPTAKLTPSTALIAPYCLRTSCTERNGLMGPFPLHAACGSGRPARECRPAATP